MKNLLKYEQGSFAKYYGRGGGDGCWWKKINKDLGGKKEENYIKSEKKALKMHLYVL